jgi:predicted alpha/beta hydrolase
MQPQTPTPTALKINTADGSALPGQLCGNPTKVPRRAAGRAGHGVAQACCATSARWLAEQGIVVLISSFRPQVQATLWPGVPGFLPHHDRNTWRP